MTLTGTTARRDARLDTDIRLPAADRLLDVANLVGDGLDVFASLDKRVRFGNRSTPWLDVKVERLMELSAIRVLVGDGDSPGRSLFIPGTEKRLVIEVVLQRASGRKRAQHRVPVHHPVQVREALAPTLLVWF